MNRLFELLYQEFKFPFRPYDFQQRIIEMAAGFDKVLLPLKVGTGKTAIATWLGLWSSMHSNTRTLMFLVPAPLVIQWGRWLESIKFIDGSPLDVLVYVGSPKQREKMHFDHDCVVMSHQIFSKDYVKRLAKIASRNDIFVVYDESQDGLRKVGNKIWRHFRSFTVNKKTVLMSGTPVSVPMDNYAVIKLLTPETYKTKRAFERMHVADRDFFGNITEWKELELLRQNLYLRAVEMLPGEGKQLPGLVVEKIPYNLSPKHLKLYNKLALEELLKTDSGGIIDATETTRMFHALQRFVTSPHLMDMKKVQAALFKILLQLYNEDDSKLIIFSNYRDTNKGVLEFFLSQNISAVGAWGAYTQKQQQKSKDAFMYDEDTRVLVANPQSVGVGTDGLQKVCYRELFTEMPLTPTRFEQATGRIDRDGQNNLCVAKCLVAEDTIQESLFFSLLNKNDLLQQITRGQQDIRELLI